MHYFIDMIESKGSSCVFLLWYHVVIDFRVAFLGCAESQVGHLRNRFQVLISRISTDPEDPEGTMTHAQYIVKIAKERFANQSANFLNPIREWKNCELLCDFARK